MPKIGSDPTALAMSKGELLKGDVYYFYSPKIRSNVVVKTELAAWVWLFYEFNPVIDWMCPRPLKIDARISGGTLKFLMDLYLRWKGGEAEYIKIQSSQNLDHSTVPPVPKRWAAVCEWMQEHSLQCRFITDTDLRDQSIKIGSYRRMLRFCHYAHQHEDPTLSQLILEEITEAGPRTFLGLTRTFSRDVSESVIAQATLHIHAGNLRLDWSNGGFHPKALILEGRHREF